jgi:hypothetical protein
MMTKIIEDRIDWLEIQSQAVNMKQYYDYEIKGLKFCLDLVKQSDAEKQELIDALIDTTKRFCELMEKHSCGDLEKFLMPVFFENKQLIEKHTGKTWEQIDVKR